MRKLDWGVSNTLVAYVSNPIPKRKLMNLSLRKWNLKTTSHRQSITLFQIRQTLSYRQSNHLKIILIKQKSISLGFIVYFLLYINRSKICDVSFTLGTHHPHEFGHGHDSPWVNDEHIFLAQVPESISDLVGSLSLQRMAIS